MNNPRKESNIQNAIRLAASENGCVLFRANAGLAWVGNKMTRMKDGSLLIKEPRPFHGMIEGFPDLVGWKSIEVTPEMVGQKIAIVIMPEVKTPTGKKRDAQERFSKKAISDGARYGFVRSVDDFVELVK